MTAHQPTAAVRESFAQAQQQAAAMTGPPTPWKAATRAPGRSQRWIGLAAASIIVGGLAGWVGVAWWADPARVESVGAPTAGNGVDAPAPAHESLNARSGPNGFAQPAPSIAPAVAAPSLAVTRKSGVIRIESTDASLADAVRALAQATRTSVTGGEVLAAIAIPITMQWQGKDTAAAWDALLGRFANFAVSCGADACTLWIAGVTASQAGGGLSSAHGALAGHQPAPPPRPGVRQEVAPPHDNNENDESN